MMMIQDIRNAQLPFPASRNNQSQNPATMQLEKAQLASHVLAVEPSWERILQFPGKLSQEMTLGTKTNYLYQALLRL